MEAQGCVVVRGGMPKRSDYDDASGPGVAMVS